MAMLYALGSLAAVPLLLPVGQAYAGAVGASGRAVFAASPRITMSQTVASRWSGKEFAKGFAWESVPVYGSARNVVAISRLSGGPYINRPMLSRTAGAIAGQVVWTAAYAYAAQTIASQYDRDQGASDSIGSRGGSRRRRFQYEYAYKF